MNLIDTTFSLRPKYLLAISAALCFLMTLSASAQSVTIPSANTNDSSSRLPLGCFYGYERTAALYLNSEIGLSGYVTQVGFYVNELNSPAINTPVVIKMKSTSNTSLSSGTYDAESSGAIIVWSGNVTHAMLSVDSWITFNVITPFNVGSSNLEVIVETNFGSFGGENWNAKQFRQSDANANLCEYWQEDDTLPTEFGELTTMRPNIQLTLAPECSGTPVPGNTMSDVNPVCTGSPFTLSLQNIAAEPGLTYQWQSSPDGSTWTNISGATNATYSTTETATTYYQSIVTCTNGGSTATSSSLQVALEAFYHCYCASFAVTSEDTKIDSVNFGDINTGTDPFLCETYTDYTAFSTSLTPGQPNTIHISNGSCTGEAYEAFAAVYIDYNHNAAFTDASELAFTYGPIFTLNGIPDQAFFVPLTALSGTTGMRIVLQEGDAVPSSCSTYTRGETEDYLVNIDALSPCSGAPPVDSTLSTLYSVCPYEDFTLSLKTYPAGTGISYAWQQSTDGINFSAVPGIATTPVYVDTGQVIAHYYRCKITCSGGSFSYSISILVTMNPFYECYCPSYATNVQNDTKIDTVKFGTLNTGSAPDHCEFYTDYTSIITDLSEGIPTTIHIVNGSCDQQFYEAMVAVYIDYNQDTSYDGPGELVYSYGPTTGLNTIPDGIITVPATATDGLTGMRIIIQEGDTVPGSCGLYLDGETEDYVVNITSGVCIDPPTPGTATATISSICSGALPVTFSVSLTGYSSGSGQTYQWQSSADGVNFTDIPGQTSTNATETINSGGATTYYRVQVHCGNTTLPSAAAVVTVNPSPVGNTIDDPIIVMGFPYSEDNNNLTANCWTSNYTGPSQQASPDVFYKVETNNIIGSLQASTCPTTDLNTYIHILDASQFHLTSNDNNGPLCNSVEASDTIQTDAFNQFYYVVIEGHADFEGTYHLDLHFITADEVSAPEYDSQISLFPNPNSGVFDLSFDLHQNINGEAKLSITNSVGQLVNEEMINVVNGKLTKEISLGDRAWDGLFIANIRVNDLSFNRRFIIQH